MRHQWLQVDQSPRHQSYGFRVLFQSADQPSSPKSSGITRRVTHLVAVSILEGKVDLIRGAVSKGVLEPESVDGLASELDVAHLLLVRSDTNDEHLASEAHRLELCQYPLTLGPGGTEKKSAVKLGGQSTCT
jgi:hypothetical protein